MGEGEERIKNSFLVSGIQKARGCGRERERDCGGEPGKGSARETVKPASKSQKEVGGGSGVWGQKEGKEKVGKKEAKDRRKKEGG